MEAICRAVIALVKEFDDIEFTIPVHPSPTVRGTFEVLRAAHDRIRLLPPLTYERLVVEMARSHLIVTDSGGIQEEAPSFGKPVLVTRDTTERPEAMELGLARLVGTDERRLFAEMTALLDDRAAYSRMSRVENPYGDGRASRRIAGRLIIAGAGDRPPKAG